MKRVVKRAWMGLVRKHGGTVRDCEAAARAFDYPGFEHP
jgi:hypothetical protein